MMWHMSLVNLQCFINDYFFLFFPKKYTLVLFSFDISIWLLATLVSIFFSFLSSFINLLFVYYLVLQLQFIMCYLIFFLLIFFKSSIIWLIFYWFSILLFNQSLMCFFLNLIIIALILFYFLLKFFFSFQFIPIIESNLVPSHLFFYFNFLLIVFFILDHLCNL